MARAQESDVRLVKTVTNQAGNHRRISVLLVDDHPILRHGLTSILEATGKMRVCADTNSPFETLRLIDKHKPDLAIVDISLGALSGFGLIESIHRTRKDLPVLVLTMHEESAYAERALRCGARGYVMKKQATETILNAIERVLQGELYVAEEIKNRLLDRLIGSTDKSSLSPMEMLSNRELEVFRMIGQGLKASGVAEALSLSVKTIQTHCEHIKRKLALSNSRELTIFAASWVRDDTLRP